MKQKIINVLVIALIFLIACLISVAVSRDSLYIDYKNNQETIDKLKGEIITLEKENKQLKIELVSKEYEIIFIEEEAAVLEEEDINPPTGEISFTDGMAFSGVRSEMLLPPFPTDMYVMEDYRSLNLEYMDHYKIQQDPQTRTNELGIRTYNDGVEDYFLCAMGTAYGRTVGLAYHVTLENGYEFNIMWGDSKGDDKYWGDPCQNYDYADCMNVIEFIVDMDKVPEKNKKLGTFSHDDLLPFNANIAKMECLGIRWFNI